MHLWDRAVTELGPGSWDNTPWHVGNHVSIMCKAMLSIISAILPYIRYMYIHDKIQPKIQYSHKDRRLFINCFGGPVAIISAY